jgi:RNA polymerase sigma-70 factor (ECF subfamily)
MPHASPAPDPARLLAEVGWLRALAARLVGRAELAEEVVQETLLAAIERRPRHASERGMRAWLAAVARNLARRAYGRERARAGVERVGARGEAIESAAAALERVELHRLLVEAVVALEEPYRSAVIWRHLDEAAGRRGAAGTSVETAPARQRGLGSSASSMRGGRAVWSARSSRAWISRPSATTAGVTSMSVAAHGEFRRGKRGGVDRDGGHRAQRWRGWSTTAWSDGARGNATTRRRQASPQTLGGGGGARGEGLAAEGDANKDAHSPTNDRVPAMAERARLSGRVVNRQGNGIPSVSVWLAEPLASELGLVGIDTDSHGSFAWEIEVGSTITRPDSFEIHAAHPAFVEVAARVTPDLPCEIRLLELPRVVGRLLDADGLPARGPAEVRLVVVAASGETVELAAETDTHGRYEARQLPRGRLVEISGRARGFAKTRRELDLALEGGDESIVDLALGPGVRVSGIVIDASTREPIAGALVFAERYQYDENAVEPLAVADEQGRFELTGVQVDRLHDVDGTPPARVGILEIDARAEGYASSPLRRSAISMDRDVVEELEIALERASAALRGQVLAPDGETPVAEKLLWVTDAKGNHRVVSTDGRHFRDQGLPAG